MKKYKVTITETLEREVEVEAPDWNHALDIVEEQVSRVNGVLLSPYMQS